jgi:hypothetical protein
MNGRKAGEDKISIYLFFGSRSNIKREYLYIYCYRRAAFTIKKGGAGTAIFVAFFMAGRLAGCGLIFRAIVECTAGNYGKQYKIESHYTMQPFHILQSYL